MKKDFSKKEYQDEHWINQGFEEQDVELIRNEGYGLSEDDIDIEGL